MGLNLLLPFNKLHKGNKQLESNPSHVIPNLLKHITSNNPFLPELNQWRTWNLRVGCFAISIRKEKAETLYFTPYGAGYNCVGLVGLCLIRGSLMPDAAKCSQDTPSELIMVEKGVNKKETSPPQDFWFTIGAEFINVSMLSRMTSKKILLIMIFEYGKDFQTYTVKFKAIIMLLFSTETLPKVLLWLLSDSHWNRIQKGLLESCRHVNRKKSIYSKIAFVTVESCHACHFSVNWLLCSERLH